MRTEIQNLNALVSSTTKLLNRMKYYGNGDITKLSLLKVIIRYACFMGDSCYSGGYDCHRKIKALLSKLEAGSPDICYVEPNFNSSPLISERIHGTIDSLVSNIPPLVSDSSVSVGNDPFIFSMSPFIRGFYDRNGDSYKTIRIKTLPASGILTYDGVAVNIDQEFDNPTNLIYTRGNSEAYTDVFTFQISDDNSNKLFSNIANVSLVVTEQV